MLSSSHHTLGAIARQSIAARRAFHSSAPRRIVHHVTTAREFQNAVLWNERVIVDCSAKWCGPCRAIAPILERHSEDDAFKGKIHFVKFDVDQVPAVTKALGVRAMPTFFFFRKGRKVDEMVGANPTALLEALKKIAE